jgi:hypothetical protein
LSANGYQGASAPALGFCCAQARKLGSLAPVDGASRSCAPF